MGLGQCSALFSVEAATGSFFGTTPRASDVYASDPRSGTFEISEASGVRTGTKITLHLKEDCKEFANEERIKGESWRKVAVPWPWFESRCRE